ncbi:uncharacterized protein LOC119385132 [Rhipicephalus sanguineus]|uniref:Uncharacterized protein n=1 Tax=Rhipicephalus sanguineus TaxID=34632 RepID=A0A9D4T0J0_RHISA|nr:uncharacterized protein LOC119385132 [Rhipicephalus sanguineus]KAH7962278.1 hypothetical protein HPB52_015319 [Rhipicephalus sanguineus]
MQARSERGLEPSSTQASPVRDARSSSIISSLPDTTSIKSRTSSVSDGSGAELSAVLVDSVGDRPRRSLLHLSLTSTVGIFALVAIAAFAFSVLRAGSTAFQEDLGAMAATESEEAVLVNGVPLVDEPPPAPRRQIKYGFEDEPVHWKVSSVAELDLGAGTEKGSKPQCGQFQFSFCSERKGGGAYFDPTLASCLAVSPELVYVCNRSPNRFSSLEECRRSCVEPVRPHRRCMATPVFSLCDRELTKSWWFSNGTQCEEWRFPLGLCPAQKSSVFSSARQCSDSCLRPRDKLHCCHRPEPHVCTLGQLKYPYFAAVGYDGCFRCLEATASALMGYQCLIGANRFDTIDACNSTCVDDSGDHE